MLALPRHGDIAAACAVNGKINGQGLPIWQGVVCADGDKFALCFGGQVIAAGVETGGFPEGKCKRLCAALVVVGGRTPEVGAHGIVQQLHTVIADGHKALAAAKDILEAIALYADVAVHLHQLWGGQGQPGGGMVVPYLPKSGFITRRDAGQRSPLDGGNGHAGKPSLRQSERKRDVHGFAGCTVCPQHRPALRLAVDRGRKHKVVGVQVGKEIPVFNHGFGVGQGDLQRCIGRLDGVHLGGIAAVGQHKAVHAEFPVGGAVSKVAAVGKAGLSVRTRHGDAVVHILPDKPALIQRLFVGILGVVGDAAAAVAHGVAVLAHDKRLFRVPCQKLFDVCHRGIHLAFHIGGGGVFPVPENTLVVHKAAGVGAAEILTHLPQGLAAVALVAARPDEDGRVVFVPFQHGFGAGKHIFPPLRACTGQRPLV